MARNNIFELLNAKWDIGEEIDRLNKLFDDNKVISSGPLQYTLREFVDSYCFDEWENRGRYIDVDDYAHTTASYYIGRPAALILTP